MASIIDPSIVCNVNFTLLAILLLLSIAECSLNSQPSYDSPETSTKPTQDSTSTSTPIATTIAPMGGEDANTTSKPIEPEETTATGQVANQTESSLVCVDDNYCLNGGTCVRTPAGSLDAGGMTCVCPEEFYGSRCQTRNICKSLIADSSTGDQICARIERECFKNDRFFRCSCHQDEYFVFMVNQETSSSSHSARAKPRNTTPRIKPPFHDIIDSQSSMFHYESLNEDPISRHDGTNEQATNQRSYVAECRKIDKCLGVRCRQMSEVCSGGRCVCNDDLGFIRDPVDNLCKLIDPCQQTAPDGGPICGQAKCVATYDKESYRCVCPFGYKAIKVSQYRSSTQCALLTDSVCEIPLMNNCQHICQVDRMKNKYRCSCLPGYKQGNDVGVDDHMCFFNENLDGLDHDEEQTDDKYTPNADRVAVDYVYAPQSRPKISDHLRISPPRVKETFTYDTPATRAQTNDPSGQANIFVNMTDSDGTHHSNVEIDLDEILIKRYPSSKDSRDKSGRHGEDDHFAEVNLAKMNAQERCNMYCEENKICILEAGSTDSYRCICDRQGYVSVGDRCLDWCSAAEFSYRVRGLLESVCYSGACKPTSTKPMKISSTEDDQRRFALEQKSSWRPTFECDCSHSPLLYKDPETNLCKLDFKAILRPCLPGNEGFIECVEHKNAFCAVLYQSNWLFSRELLKERFNESPDNLLGNLKASSDDNFGGSSSKSKWKVSEKSYTCVCSPEKKFLVDKPRNKARCVDECDLLNNECGRFNRMCRAATISPDDFGHRNLVRIDPDGPRMNFKRTGCECLPGFNVGPSESVDFTLDDNNPKDLMNSALGDSYLSVIDSVNHNDLLDDHEHLRTKYININSRCLLDYDVVEFRASFKAPTNFDPRWVKIRNLESIETIERTHEDKNSEQDNPADEEEHSTDRLANDDSSSDLSEASHKREKIIKNDSYLEARRNPLDQDYILQVPDYMTVDISEFHKSVVFVGICDAWLGVLSIEAYQECIKYRYWIVRKLRSHFADWRRVMTDHLRETFDMMEGNIRLRVNKCEATIKKLTTLKHDSTKSSDGPPDQRPGKVSTTSPNRFDPMDQYAVVDADIDCELTLHSASDGTCPRYSRKVLLEKQLPKFIFNKPIEKLADDYYLMAPKLLIQRESFDNLAEHRRVFSPCKSDYDYCDKQTKCEMVDTVNFTCTCEYGYTPIGSRDLYYEDSRKEVCEDINECLFDVCKELENVSTCINEIGDYRCQCNRHYTGDNKRYCTHVCNTIPCKHGKCRLVDDHHAFCDCEEGYKEADCSVQDPSVALRKANIIICGSIFTSVLLLATTIAISLNSQLKKTKKKLKRLEAANEAAHLFDLSHQQPFRPRLSKVSVCS